MSLSYQHRYHAGGFADLHKHLWLVATLSYLTRKDKPLFWLDGHGGGGLYDLQGLEARKTAEAEGGILALEPNASQLSHPLWRLYWQLIASCNPGADSMLRYYPGSALLAAKVLRPTDRLLCCELHPGEVRQLKASLESYPLAKVQQVDMAKAWPATLPPRERRGGLLLDPSYELKTDYETVPRELVKAVKKWPTGIYLLWYPLLAAKGHERLKRYLGECPGEVLIDEWHGATVGADGRGLLGSGMAVVNPPYTVPEEMAALKDQLWPLLGRG
ncbi:MAG: 23S rRNA (adenine(2030)-N(6))-methyltransferase RlmJ [Candidatus Competibacterales bacterium]